MREAVRAGLVVVGLVGLTVAPGQAQEPGSWWCLRGAPAPECRGFVRIEARGGGSIGETVRYRYGGTRDASGALVATDSTAVLAVGDWIGGEVGYAVNVGEAWAVGGSAFLEGPAAIVAGLVTVVVGGIAVLVGGGPIA